MPLVDGRHRVAAGTDDVLGGVRHAPLRVDGERGDGGGAAPGAGRDGGEDNESRIWIETCQVTTGRSGGGTTATASGDGDERCRSDPSLGIDSEARDVGRVAVDPGGDARGDQMRVRVEVGQVPAGGAGRAVVGDDLGDDWRDVI